MAAARFPATQVLDMYCGMQGRGSRDVNTQYTPQWLETVEMISASYLSWPLVECEATHAVIEPP